MPASSLACRRRLQTPLLFVASLLFPAELALSQAPTVTRDFTIGCADCGGALQFSSFQTLEISSKGELLVADRDNPVLRLFDAAGKPIWTGGQKGQGPGEYRHILRGAFRPDGGLDLVDFTGRRLTTLGLDRKVVSTHTLQTFPTTAGANDKGAIVLGAETPSGGIKVFRVRKGALEPVTVPEVSKPAGERAFKGSSVALAPDGTLAIIPSNDRYQIIRIDSAGKRLPDVTRDLERERRTPAEEQGMRAKVRSGMGQTMEAMEKSAGKSSSTAPAPILEHTQLDLKPHFAVDGMRYDSAGRLWVRTMRGDGAQTIFDVFSPSGTLLGSVRIDGQVQLFALAGDWLVTSGENSDGIPVVTRWTVRRQR
jgi:hypothetical protein